MNLTLAKKRNDPRINCLIARADKARLSKDFREADRLEAEAEALISDDQLVEIELERGDDKVPPPPNKFLLQLRQLNELKTKSKPRKIQDRKQLEHMQRLETEQTTKKSESPVQDRTRLQALLSQFPVFKPFAHLGKSEREGKESETARYGLAGVGAGLMAVEPAAGGILLMFSCIFNALTDEVEEDTEPTPAQAEEEEQVEESREADLFRAGAPAMKWLIAQTSCPSTPTS